MSISLLANPKVMEYLSSVSRSLRGKRAGSDSDSPADEGGRSNCLEKAAKASFKKDLTWGCSTGR